MRKPSIKPTSSKPTVLTPAEARERLEEHRKLLAKIEARCAELERQLSELEARLPKLDDPARPEPSPPRKPR